MTQTCYTLYSEWDIGLEGNIFPSEEEAEAFARKAVETYASDVLDDDQTFEDIWGDLVGTQKVIFHGLLPSPVKGYKPLPEATVAAMNKIKESGASLGALMDEIAADAEVAPDGRWFAIARTQLQQGFMALTRSVAKPEFF